MQASRSVSVVVPAYNEEACLAESLRILGEYLARRAAPHEILVIDDGSTDATSKIAEAWPDPHTKTLRQASNLGKGAAVRRGVEASTGSLVLLCDADLSTPIRELERLEAHLDGAQLVLGSRRSPGARLRRTRSRRFVSWVFNTIVHLAGLCRGLHDTQCGFKLIDGDAARSLFPRLQLDGFAFDLELIELARYEGLEVREVGIEWNDAGESTVRPLKHGVEMLRDVLAVRRRIRSLPKRA